MDSVQDRVTAHLSGLSGWFDRGRVQQLAWPIAWAGHTPPEVAEAVDAARSALRADCLRALDETPDAVAVVLCGGVIESVEVST